MKKFGAVFFVLILCLRGIIFADISKENSDLLNTINLGISNLVGDNTKVEDISSLTANIKKISIQLKNGKFAIVYYLVDEDTYIVGNLYHHGKNLTKMDNIFILAKRKKKLLEDEYSLNSNDSNISTLIDDIDDAKRAEKSDINKLILEAVNKFTDSPKKLIDEVKKRGSYSVLKNKGKEQVLLIMNPSCSACQSAVSAGKIEKVLEKAEIVIYFTSNKSDSKIDKIKAFYLNRLKGTNEEKVKKIRELFSKKNIILQKRDKKSYKKFLSDSEYIEKQRLIKVFPVVLAIDSLFGKDFRFSYNKDNIHGKN